MSRVQLLTPAEWEDIPLADGAEVADGFPIRACKVGHIVHVECPRLLKKPDGQDWVAQLPAKFRPDREVRFLSMVWGGATYSGWIRTGGQIVPNTPTGVAAVVLMIPAYKSKT